MPMGKGTYGSKVVRPPTRNIRTKGRKSRRAFGKKRGK